MNTKLVMTASAVTLGVAGVVMSFAPDEILSHYNWGNNEVLLFLIQILGALYFAFAVLNWMAKSSLIGGIYNRPIAIANFTHFLIAGLALAKGVFAYPELPISVLVAGAV